ncbi:Hypothetical_protein [Hexamita inflata]|uniref:Hypothetical_protein n=1 Tax=Hexamita inflata TaxID=28002 RepID=A0AA86Q796_9EUKA|nr:Hypothetical protein HINF_LOCUS40243 [Hexamita inflata]
MVLNVVKFGHVKKLDRFLQLWESLQYSTCLIVLLFTKFSDVASVYTMLIFYNGKIQIMRIRYISFASRPIYSQICLSQLIQKIVSSFECQITDFTICPALQCRIRLALRCRTASRFCSCSRLSPLVAETGPPNGPATSTN